MSLSVPLSAAFSLMAKRSDELPVTQPESPTEDCLFPKESKHRPLWLLFLLQFIH